MDHIGLECCHVAERRGIRNVCKHRVLGKHAYNPLPWNLQTVSQLDLSDYRSHTQTVLHMLLCVISLCSSHFSLQPLNKISSGWHVLPFPPYFWHSGSHPTHSQPIGSFLQQHGLFFPTQSDFSCAESSIFFISQHHLFLFPSTLPTPFSPCSVH